MTPSNDDEYQEIPDYLISLETLLWLGFSQERAETHWKHWNSDEWDGGREIDDGPITFEYAMLAEIHLAHEMKSEDDTISDDDDEWRKTMDAYGISQDTQDAILTPRCKPIRLTETCLYWLKDLMRAGFAHLRAVKAASRERVVAAARTDSRPGGSASTNVSRTSLAAGSGGGTSSSTPIPTHASPALSANAPGSIVLFRSGWAHRFNGILDMGDDFERRKGRIGKLQSAAGGDFNQKHKAIYLAHDLKVARQYADWAKTASKGKYNVVVLRVEVANSAIENLDPNTERLKVFWDSTEWKKLVYACRTLAPLGDPVPKDLAKYHRATLVIGSIMAKPTCVINEKEQTYKDIKHSMVKIFDGCAQYVFMGDKGVDLLAKHAKGFQLFPWIHQNEDKMRVAFGLPAVEENST